MLLRAPVLAVLLLSGCGAAQQPESNRTVAAYEVALPAEADRAAFGTILSRTARAHGLHADVATADELHVLSEVSPVSFSAAVWVGDDEEAVLSAMDGYDHLGRIWIVFSQGTEPDRFESFRDALMPQIERRWPDTTTLPIAPSGAIPLPEDLVRTPSGYAIKPGQEDKYAHKPTWR